VLHRGRTQLQVGLEPTAVLVAHAGAAALVEHLDGHHDLAVLRALGAGVGMAPADVDAVLRALDGARLLAPSPRTPGRTRTAVRLVGLGPLGRQVLRLLLAAGLRVYAADGHPDPTRRRAVRPLDLEDLPRPRGGGLTLVNHWSKPEQVPLALTVVAADTVEPDRLLTDALLRNDAPHLVLRAAGRGVTVGPLVLPGRTACLRCTDLTRRDADPGWPVLLGQLVTLRLATPAVLLAWAASLGATQVLAHLQGQLPESGGATVELGEQDHLMRWRAWPVHPGCGCSWSGTTQWGP
jgi:hypothetical protein